MSDKELAQIAYEAYGDAVNWIAFSGVLMPQWADNPEEKIRDAWRNAAQAVVDKVNEDK